MPRGGLPKFDPKNTGVESWKEGFIVEIGIKKIEMVNILHFG